MSNGDLNVKLKIDGDAKGAQQAIAGTEKSLQGLGDAGKGARVAADGVDEIGHAAGRAEIKSTSSHRKISDGIKSISEQLSEVKTLYAAWIGVQQAGSAIAGVAATADAYANLSARIKLATGDGAAFQTAFQGVQDVALRTNTSLESTGNLFVKLAEAGKQIGVGQADALRLTETVNQAIQLSGASAQASEAAVTQLIQGLQGGVLRGDEFNSIMEQSPRLAKALAEGLGVTTGELRKMAEAGQLSSETVIGALKGQAAAVDAEFGKLPATIGRAITDLNTQWQLWIGTLDQSSGASKTAAGAIEALANNFDLVASGLINAGQAYLGWKAYNIAAEFLSLKTAVAASAAAKTADTVATVANTAATAANTTAQVANNAAKTGAAAAGDLATASAGRLAGALSLVKGLSFAFLLTNIVDIGKWLGEAAAKAMGYGKAMEDNERQSKAAANAARAQADENAALAQQQKLAADAALGLSERSKKLVADFDELTKKGETTAEALAKIGKDMDLSNIKGIGEAGAALDALAVKGKASAEQVRVAWQQALNGQDLQAFEVNARAAFDGSEQGARRLAAALDAQLGEALRRTGLDAGALSDGVNKAAQLAINDFDVMIGRLDDMKGRGVDTGIALAASLDQAGKAATTEAAVKEVIRRWEELGAAGLVTGPRLADGLEKARQKLDEITPGINSLAEAFKTLGMKSPEELNKIARSAEEAFAKIKSGSDYSVTGLANTREAFRRMAEASIAANGGIASDSLKAQAGLYGLTIETDNTGKAMIRLAGSTYEAGEAAGASSGGFDRMSSSMDRAANSANRLRDAQRGITGADGVTRNADGQHVDPKTGEVLLDKNGKPITNSTSLLDQGNTAPGKVDWETEMYKQGASVKEVQAALKYVNELYARQAATKLTGNLGNSTNAARQTNLALKDAVKQSIVLAQKELATGQAIDLGPSVGDLAKKNLATTDWLTKGLTDAGGTAAVLAAWKNAGNEAIAQNNKSLGTLNLTINGKRNQITTDAAGAKAIEDLLKQLEADASRTY